MTLLGCIWATPLRYVSPDDHELSSDICEKRWGAEIQYAASFAISTHGGIKPSLWPVAAFCIQHDQPIPSAAAGFFLDVLMSERSSDLRRVNGLINIAGQPETPMVIHGVQHVIHVPAYLYAWPFPDACIGLNHTDQTSTLDPRFGGDGGSEVFEVLTSHPVSLKQIGWSAGKRNSRAVTRGSGSKEISRPPALFELARTKR
ncbi:MAG: GTP-binding protein [Geminicoccaceae bacterium]